MLSAVGSVDGSVDKVERAVLEALFKTLPQLRDHPSSAPPRANRTRILEELAKLEDEALRYQCWVVAVELAIASDGINELEDQYLEQLQQALRNGPAHVADANDGHPPHEALKIAPAAWTWRWT